jgi:hypothetical protein
MTPIHPRLDTKVEASASGPEVFENADDKFRRQYAELGADFAYFIAQFLRGRRRLEIQPEEILKTQLYLRANDAERRGLNFICEVDHPMRPSPDDELKLRVRDQFLIDYVDGLILGHADLVAEIRSIPLRVAAREQADRSLFAKVYESPRLFEWIWKAR